jgi:hypothetical protein
MPAPVNARNPRCASQDSDELCFVLSLTIDVGRTIYDDNHANVSCRDAAARLNAWSDRNRDGLARMAQLSNRPRAELDAFQQRHGADFTATFGIAMEFDTRCPGDRNVDDALSRAGFSGLIGAPGN